MSSSSAQAFRRLDSCSGVRSSVLMLFTEGYSILNGRPWQNSYSRDSQNNLLAMIGVVLERQRLSFMLLKNLAILGYKEYF